MKYLREKGTNRVVIYSHYDDTFGDHYLYYECKPQHEGFYITTTELNKNYEPEYLAHLKETFK